ncbi:hypothetical protein RJT34_02250 [Clitoria ternatea]|uniref:Uncharacterized protein n=1 Tax=Clitoria ternatea TaxID=43366 RepID=A0AAN9KIF5_CLITE
MPQVLVMAVEVEEVIVTTIQLGHFQNALLGLFLLLEIRSTSLSPHLQCNEDAAFYPSLPATNIIPIQAFDLHDIYNDKKTFKIQLLA